MAMTKLSIVGGMVCLGVLPIVCAAAELYKWTDAQGQVHYGDNPHKGATRIRKDDVQTYTPPRASRETVKLSPPAKDKTKAPSFSGYDSVTVVSPQADETIWNNEGTLAASVRIEPELQISLGHHLQFVLDGKPNGETLQATTTNLTEIDRGSHTLSAVVLDGDGKQIAQAPAINFFIKKVSRLQRTENLHGRRR